MSLHLNLYPQLSLPELFQLQAARPARHGGKGSKGISFHLGRRCSKCLCTPACGS